MGDRRDILETVANDAGGRRYTVEHETSEFTFLYPKTGQPCFARVALTYVPRAQCLEMMSLKRYLNTYRDEPLFFEAVTNRVLDDLASACDPAEMTVAMRFTVRGGIETTVTARTP